MIVIIFSLRGTFKERDLAHLKKLQSISEHNQHDFQVLISFILYWKTNAGFKEMWGFGQEDPNTTIRECMPRSPGQHLQHLGRLGCFHHNSHLFSYFPGILPKYCMETRGEADRLAICLEKDIYYVILTSKAVAGISAAPPRLKLTEPSVKTEVECDCDIPAPGKHVCFKGRLIFHFAFHVFSPPIVSHYAIWRELYPVLIQT